MEVQVMIGKSKLPSMLLPSQENVSAAKVRLGYKSGTHQGV